MRYAVVIEQAESNYSAYVPDLPGCVTTGASVHESGASDPRGDRAPSRWLARDGTPIPPATSRVDYVEAPSAAEVAPSGADRPRRVARATCDLSCRLSELTRRIIHAAAPVKTSADRACLRAC